MEKFWESIGILCTGPCLLSPIPKGQNAWPQHYSQNSLPMGKASPCSLGVCMSTNLTSSPYHFVSEKGLAREQAQWQVKTGINSRVLYSCLWQQTERSAPICQIPPWSKRSNVSHQKYEHPLLEMAKFPFHHVFFQIQTAHWNLCWCIIYAQ